MEHSEQTSDSGNFWQGNPKTMFALGLVTGVAVMSVIALVFVLDFLFSGKTAGAMAVNNQQQAQQVAQQPTDQQPTDQQPTQPSQPPKAVDDKDHIWGNKNAKVTLIEYSDFECPYCARHYDTIKQIQQAYPNDVRIVFRHFPLSFHANAQKAAEASECAGAQGKFWEMHDKIFEANKAAKMGVDQWKQDAKDLKLDTAKFNKCLDGGEMASVISADQTEASNAGVSGTPATFVNGELIEGALPFASFQAKIDAALK
ncbi:MAG: DsbA family protein [Patescibacteria group bacterium]|nr:DsbA family protein [Patescibacteria group bacterium]